MIEHAPWRGDEYSLGISGQKIAVVGYSHYGSTGEEDTVEKTRGCIRRVIPGEWKLAFFTQIRNYFGYDDHGAFWSRLIFFNFLPNFAGDPDNRYMHGTEEQRALGRDRFVRLIQDEQPEKVFIFTSRHWAFERDKERCQLGPNFPPGFSWSICQAGNRRATAFFLRHPQGASGELMRQAVKYVLEVPSPLEKPALHLAPTVQHILQLGENKARKTDVLRIYRLLSR